MDLGNHLGGEGSLYRETQLFLVKHRNAPTERGNESVSLSPVSDNSLVSFPSWTHALATLGAIHLPRAAWSRAKTVKVPGLKRDPRGACILMTLH